MHACMQRHISRGDACINNLDSGLCYWVVFPSEQHINRMNINISEGG